MVSPARRARVAIAAVLSGSVLWACTLISDFSELTNGSAEGGAAGDSSEEGGAGPFGGRTGEAGAAASDPGGAGLSDGGSEASGGESFGEAGAGASDAEHEVPYHEVVLADDPLAYFRLGESEGDVAADAVGDFPGRYVGEAIEYGVAGLVRGGDTAIRLTGAERVVIGDSFSFADGQPFSLEAWIQAETLDDEIRVVMAKPFTSEVGEQGYSLAVRQEAGIRFWFARDGQQKRVLGDYSVRQVAHVVATYDGQTARVYVNGVQLGSGRIPFTLVENEGEFVLGNSRQGIGFVGILDEVAVYGVALSPERVRAHYDAGKP